MTAVERLVKELNIKDDDIISLIEDWYHCKIQYDIVILGYQRNALGFEGSEDLLNEAYAGLLFPIQEKWSIARMKLTDIYPNRVW